MNEPTAQRSAPSGHKTQLQAPTLRVCAWTNHLAGARGHGEVLTLGFCNACGTQKRCEPRYME
jgi:hypothetical protein